jgi:hypothetical protein
MRDGGKYAAANAELICGNENGENDDEFANGHGYGLRTLKAHSLSHGARNSAAGRGAPRLLQSSASFTAPNEMKLGSRLP